MFIRFKKPQTWLYGLLTTFITGFAHAAAGMVVAPGTFNIHEGLSKLLSLATISGIISAFAYLQKSPLPELEEKE